MIKLTNHTDLFKYVRFALMVIILICCLQHIIGVLTSFDKTLLPLAKNQFLFVNPSGVKGESDVSDFTTFYACGLLNKERMTKNIKLDVYDPILLTLTVERIIAPMRPVEVYYIQYPPIIFALTTPLAYLDIYSAWRLWFFCSTACLIIAFMCLAFNTLKTRPLLILALLIFLFTAPVTHNLAIGQTTAFEAATIALAMSLLLNRKFFWAGIVAGLSFLKLQEALIILIPGIFVGKKQFISGCLLTVFLEGLLSIYVVGYANVFNFIKANYLCEVTHSYVGLNEAWTMTNLRAMLSCLPTVIPQASAVAAFTYLVWASVSAFLWAKLYPILQRYSQQAFELIASITTVGLVYFSVHSYFYDYLLLVIPALWLYVWSTTNDESYTTEQSLLRLIIAVFTFALPLLFWTNSDLFTSESDSIGYQLRMFFGSLTLLLCAIIAVKTEFKRDTTRTLLEE